MGKFLKDINLKNKVAVVTGATKGIGRAAAIALHQVGANIVAIGRNQSELNSLKKKLKTKIILILYNQKMILFLYLIHLLKLFLIHHIL